MGKITQYIKYKKEKITLKIKAEEEGTYEAWENYYCFKANKYLPLEFEKEKVMTKVLQKCFHQTILFTENFVLCE